MHLPDPPVTDGRTPDLDLCGETPAEVDAPGGPAGRREEADVVEGVDAPPPPVGQTLPTGCGFR